MSFTIRSSASEGSVRQDVQVTQEHHLDLGLAEQIYTQSVPALLYAEELSSRLVSEKKKVNTHWAMEDVAVILIV